MRLRGGPPTGFLPLRRDNPRPKPVEGSLAQPREPLQGLGTPDRLWPPGSAGGGTPGEPALAGVRGTPTDLHALARPLGPEPERRPRPALPVAPRSKIVPMHHLREKEAKHPDRVVARLAPCQGLAGGLQIRLRPIRRIFRQDYLGP